MDGDTWQGSVFLCGRYQYTAPNGALKTVRAFATSYIEALRRTDPAAAAIEDSKVIPPFGLRWGEGSARLERLLNGAKARITKRTKSENHETWRVEGLVQTGLVATFFGFTDSKLVKVALVYMRDDWTSAQYKDFYAQVKSRIERKYSSASTGFEGNEPAAEASDQPGSIKTQESVWRKPQSVLRLGYYEIPHEAAKSMVVKVSYETDLPEVKPTESQKSAKP